MIRSRIAKYDAAPPLAARDEVVAAVRERNYGFNWR
jgi:hypothetical protein